MTPIEFRSHRIGIILMLGSTFFFSLGGPFIRAVDLDGATISFWRGLAMAAFIVLWLRMQGGKPLLERIRATGRAGWDSGLLIGPSFFLFPLAVSHGTVAETMVIMSSAPLVAALLGWMILGERVRAGTWIALAIAMAAIALMFSDGEAGSSLLGVIFAIAVTLVHGANVVLMRAKRQVDMLPAVIVGGIVCSLLAAPFASPMAGGAREIALMLTMGVAQVGIGFVLFVRATRRLSAVEVTLIGLLETILAPLWVWIGFDEEPATMAIVGGGILLATLAVHAALSDARPTAAAPAAE
jgi:drug/metabolite transporter (DMT)-like permease